MWHSFEEACAALTRDGWKRCTSYWFDKIVSGRKISVELEWQFDMLVPVLHDDAE